MQCSTQEFRHNLLAIACGQSGSRLQAAVRRDNARGSRVPTCPTLGRRMVVPMCQVWAGGELRHASRPGFLAPSAWSVV
eukprot:5570868-Amphidinium_carterae.1